MNAGTGNYSGTKGRYHNLLPALSPSQALPPALFLFTDAYLHHTGAFTVLPTVLNNAFYLLKRQQIYGSIRLRYWSTATLSHPS